MLDSETSAERLHCDNYALSIRALQERLTDIVDELKHNKDELELTLRKTLKGLATQKAELEQQGRKAIDDMRREDKEYQVLELPCLRLSTFWTPFRDDTQDWKPR